MMTPFFMCFAYDSNRHENPGLLLFEVLIDITFLVDIFVNFRTGFVLPKTHEVRMLCSCHVDAVHVASFRNLCHLN